MFEDYVTGLIVALRSTRAARTGERLAQAADLLVAALSCRRPVLVCGNGGSASDAMHIAAELVGRFRLDRRGMNVLALSANPAVMSAWANDFDWETVFARQVDAHGAPGGVLIGMSTSGRSPNVLAALAAGKALGMATVGFTGRHGGEMAPLCDVLLEAQADGAARVQEVHACMYHWLCGTVEGRMASIDGSAAELALPPPSLAVAAPAK